MVRLFRTYGNKYHFPYLLLAAQGYQESGLNPGLRSKAGAVGVMQIKPSTAAGAPIDITGIEKIDRNIEAGAKYLRYMVNHYYANEPMDQITKGLFALASYNAGPDRIEKLRPWPPPKATIPTAGSTMSNSSPPAGSAPKLLTTSATSTSITWHTR